MQQGSTGGRVWPRDNGRVNTDGGILQQEQQRGVAATSKQKQVKAEEGKALRVKGERRRRRRRPAEAREEQGPRKASSDRAFLEISGQVQATKGDLGGRGALGWDKI